MLSRGITKRPIEILLVEDNPADVRLTVEALKEGQVRHNLTVARDGHEALAHLFRRGEHSCAVRPDIVLLDLNLPRLDGREVLAELKSDRDLKRIPVLILTTSAAEEDVKHCYELHANCYITKPVDMDQFIELMQTIETFWFNTVQLPLC